MMATRLLAEGVILIKAEELRPGPESVPCGHGLGRGRPADPARLAPGCSRRDRSRQSLTNALRPPPRWSSDRARATVVPDDRRLDDHPDAKPTQHPADDGRRRAVRPMETGSMFTLSKVRDDIAPSDYREPGPYQAGPRPSACSLARPSRPPLRLLSTPSRRLPQSSSGMSARRPFSRGAAFAASRRLFAWVGLQAPC